MNNNNKNLKHKDEYENLKQDKCYDYRVLINKCLKNGGDWNGGNCSRFINLLKNCEEELVK